MQPLLKLLATKKSRLLVSALGTLPLWVFAFSHTALADAFDINTSIPGPVDISKYGILAYIQNGYLLALGAAGALAIGSIIYGAVQYTVSRGNPSKLSDAWDRIIQALLGILLLVGAGTILSIVNPGLLSLELPRILPVASTGFQADPYADIKGLNPAPRPGDLSEKPGPGGNGKCSAITAFPDNPCSVSRLSQTCFASVATQASMVCNAESNANPINYNKGYTCEGGQTAVVGLFQINLKANPVITPTGSLNCPQAFMKGGGPAKCKVINPTLYNQCVAAAKISGNSIATACKLYRSGRWQPWEVSHCTPKKYVCCGKV